MSETWQKSAFVKLASLGALVMLPTTGGRYLLQRNGPTDYQPSKLRPPGGHVSKRDKDMEATILRELKEEFGLKPEDVAGDLVFLGYDPSAKFFGNAVYLLKEHGLKPGLYQASNSKNEKITLEEASLDDKDYTGPRLSSLITEEAKKFGEKEGLTDGVDKAASWDLPKTASELLDWHKRKKLPGGLSKREGTVPSDFPAKKVQEGMKVEAEHTSDKQIQKEIVLDHLTEDIDTYPKLKKMEAGEKEAAARSLLPMFPAINAVLSSDVPEQPARATLMERLKALQAPPPAIPRPPLSEVAHRIKQLLNLPEDTRKGWEQRAQKAREVATELTRQKLETKQGSSLEPSSLPGSKSDGLSKLPLHATQAEGIVPTTGPEAIAAALENIDLARVEKDAHAAIKGGKKTKRPDAVRLLGYLEGFKRSGLHPRDLVVRRVPVIPPPFRPFAVAGDTFVPGDANELYRDLINIKGVHKELEAKLGPQGAAANRLRVYDSVKALYGFGDPVSPKTKERGVSGFLSTITGHSPKFSFLQRKLISRDQDYTGRGVIGVDPDLTLDQIGVPDEMLWPLYAPYIQRRLVRSGVKMEDAVKMIKDRHPMADKMLNAEIDERPVMYSRAPAWHKFSALGGWVKRIKEGHTIMTNPLVTTGLGADYDGDSGRFYVMIQKDVDSSEVGSQIDDTMLNINSEIRSDDQVIHIQNFPHRPETAVTKRPSVVEYDVPRGVRVYGLSRKTRKHAWLPVTKFSVHDNLEMWKVDLAGGRSVFAGADHSLVLYKNGKLELAKPEAAVGLCAPKVRHFTRFGAVKTSVKAAGEVGKRDQPVEFDFPLNRNTGLWLGLIIGDGCVNSAGAVYLYGTGDKAVNRAVFDTISHSSDMPYEGEAWQTDFTTASLGGGESLRQRTTLGDKRWFSFWIKGHIGDGALNKRIPDFSLQAADEHMLGVLDGLISTDGSISISHSKKKPQLLVNYSTSSLDLVAGMQALLERLKIRSSVSDYIATSSGRPAYIVSLSTVDLAKRHNQSPLHFNHPEKNRIFQEMIGTVTLGGIGNAGDQVPYPTHLHQVFQQAYATRNGFKKRSNGKTNFGNFCTSKSNGKWDRTVALRELAQLQAQNIWSEELEAYLALVKDESVGWVQVVAAQALPERMTGYDITVPGVFTFALDDGVIVQDTMNVHLPSLDSAVSDVKDKLMPSKMLWSIKDPTKVVPTIKQDMTLGLSQAQNRPAQAKHTFPNEATALAAIKAGKVRLSDEVTIAGMTA